MTRQREPLTAKSSAEELEGAHYFFEAVGHSAAARMAFQLLQDAIAEKRPL